MSLYHEIRRLWCMDPKLSIDDLPDDLCLAILNVEDENSTEPGLHEIVVSYGLKRSGNKFFPAPGNTKGMDFNFGHTTPWNAMAVWDDTEVLAWWKAGPHLGCDGYVQELEFEPASRSPANFCFSIGNLLPI